MLKKLYEFIKAYIRFIFYSAVVSFAPICLSMFFANDKADLSREAEYWQKKLEREYGYGVLAILYMVGFANLLISFLFHLTLVFLISPLFLLVLMWKGIRKGYILLNSFFIYMIYI